MARFQTAGGGCTPYLCPDGLVLYNNRHLLSSQPKLVKAFWVAKFHQPKTTFLVVKSVIVSCGHKMGKFGTQDLVGSSYAGLAVNDWAYYCLNIFFN